MDMVLIKSLFQNRAEAAGADDGDGGLIDDIEVVKRDIACCDEQYDLTEDFDLMEYYIYERKALLAKYRYLLGKAKMRGILCSMEKMIKNQRQA